MFEPLNPFNTSFPLIGADLAHGDDFCAVVRPNQTPICSCCTKEEYEDFLIGEYGAEKVLEVKKEEERREKELQKMNHDDKIAMLACLATFLFNNSDEK